MKNRPQPQGRLTPHRPAYRTLEGWALGVLIDQGVVVECPHHGHRIDRADPDAWNRAREEVLAEPIFRREPRSLHCRNGTHHALDRRHLPGVLIQELHIPNPPPILILFSTGGV